MSDVIYIVPGVQGACLLCASRIYPQKKVRLVSTVEAAVAVAVTVYVYYGHWED